MKRVLEIIIFPFQLIYLLISFPFKVLKIISDDKKRKQALNSKSDSKAHTNIELLQIGQLLFSKNNLEFEMFYNSFLTNYNDFITQNEELLKNYKNFGLDKLKAIDVIYIFGDARDLFLTTDWKGYENEHEIEYFIETKLNIKPDWANVNSLKQKVIVKKQNEGKFITDFLKAIDKDLAPLNKKLIFLTLDWDAYVYTVVDKSSCFLLKEKFDTLIYGTENLNK